MNPPDSDPQVKPAGGESAREPAGPTLGKKLKIRSMVTMAGEVLPFFWPMRNFIHHNPLHGLEHLPFEQAVADATKLFHARGYLTRPEYQELLARGSIEREVLEDLAAEFVNDWLREREISDYGELAELLRRSAVAMMTAMSHPAPGQDVPCPEEVLAAIKRRSS